METTNTLTQHKITSGVLALLSFAALALLYFSSKPKGLDGRALAHLFAYGSGPKIETFLSGAELRSQLLHYGQLGLPVVLILVALMSVLNCRLSRSAK